MPDIIKVINSKEVYKSKISLSMIAVSVLLLFFLMVPNVAISSMADDIFIGDSYRKISLDLDGVSLVNVLKVFSQQSGLNFIASQSVADKPITLYMQNVPIKEALDKILKSYNLTYELDETSNIFVVKEHVKAQDVSTETRVYTLKYALVNSSPINSAATVSTAGNSIVDALNKLLSSYGKISEDSRTNSLIITELPEQFKLIEETIRGLDVPVPEVLIEVEIIDTDKTLTDRLGVNWTDNLYNINLAGRSNLSFPFSMFPMEGGVKTLTDPGSILPSGGTTTPSAVLSLIKQDATTRTLARPKLLTLSNQTAEIKITTDQATSTSTTFDQQGNQIASATERNEVGIKLKVTPYVNMETGEITMTLEPEVSSAAPSALNPATSYDPSKRTAKLSVRVKNNDTVVIAGLINNQLTDTRRKVPILGDIPFAGSLFRSKQKTNENRELLVFITPRIVNNSSMALAKSTVTVLQPSDKEILSNREQSDYVYRKEEVDKVLSIWDNK